MHKATKIHSRYNGKLMAYDYRGIQISRRENDWFHKFQITRRDLGHNSHGIFHYYRFQTLREAKELIDSHFDN